VEIRPLASSSAGNATLVTDGSTPLLLDAGLRLSEIRTALQYRVTSLAGVLVTHSHGDHARGATELAKAGVDVYMLPETAAAIGATGHRVHHVTPHDTFRVGTWAARAFDLVHDVPNVGYLLASDHGHKVLLVTDTAYCPYVFRGLTHLLLETNFSDEILQRRVMNGELEPAQAYRVRRSHLGLERAIELLKANDLSRVRAIHLLHLSGGNSDAAAFADAVRRATGKPVTVAAERAQA
jgi:phosphoribosyl 1,2-cyclic phosphodiesterase